MRILVASDSFKGTLSSETVGQIVKDVMIDDVVDIITMSDGGEGMIEALEDKINGIRRFLDIKDPLNRPIKGYYLINGDQAIIESAIGCGLTYLSDREKNPLQTSSYGVGMLIDDALKRGVKHLIIGIGGTSTNDCGIGLLEALGVSFYDENDHMMVGLTGKDLSLVASVDESTLVKKLKGVTVEVACDVDNPLLGEHGATYTFGPQKGATEEMLTFLEEGMRHFSKVLMRHHDHTEYPGAGAAGGLGYCLMTMFSASLKSGVDLVLDALDFEKIVKNYDLVITGEGKIDAQTNRGKVPQGVLKHTLKANIKAAAVCGICEETIEGFERTFSIVPEVASAEESLKEPYKAFKKLVEEEIAPWIKGGLNQ